MNQKEILRAQELIEELEKLYQGKKYVFRGQPNEKFLLLPSAFRPDVIMKRAQEFPATPFFQEWRSSEELKDMVHCPLPDDYWQSLHVRRICDLTFYLMHYNFYLAKHVAMYPEKFDLATREIYRLRPSAYWHEKTTFDYLFGFIFRSSLGRETLDGTVINYSVINEEMASYDESLPQHYDTQTAALDFTRNPYVAIYFALQNIPQNSRHISLYAYQHLQEHENNPIIVESGKLECENLRIQRQEGLFLRFRYGCLYYFFHGFWPAIESFLPVNNGMFELKKFNVPVSQVSELQNVLIQKGITREFLFPDLIGSVACA